MRGSELTRRGLSVAIVSVLAWAGPARSQSAESFVIDAADTFEMSLRAPLLALASPGMSFMASEAGTSQLVKGAPYRADAVSESTQVLMDDNRIVRRSMQRLARDSEGRTRIERVRSDGTVESVMINDVVAGKRYWLLPDKKRVIELAMSRHVARMHGATPLPAPPGGVAPPAPPAPPAPVPPPPAPPASMTGEEARSWGEAMRHWARELAGRLRVEREGDDAAESRVIRDDNGAARVIIKQARGGDLRTMDVDVVRVVEPDHDAVESASAAIAAIAPLPLEAGPRGQGVTTALGSKEFDRVRADGTRTTWTIPAGKIGNEKPIDVVSERWYAPDLLLVVSSRYLDPRRGETTYRLTGLKRGEPDATLFQVPADYERRPTRGKREQRSGN